MSRSPALDSRSSSRHGSITLSSQVSTEEGGVDKTKAMEVFKSQFLQQLPLVFALVISGNLFETIDETFDAFGYAIIDMNNLPSSIIFSSIMMMIIVFTAAAIFDEDGAKKKVIPHRVEEDMLLPLGYVAGCFWGAMIDNFRDALLNIDAIEEYWLNLSVDVVFFVVVLLLALLLSVWSTEQIKTQEEFRQNKNDEIKRIQCSAKIAFRKVDHDHSGKLNEDELRRALHKFWQKKKEHVALKGNLKEHDVDTIIKLIDDDASGLITEEEFVEFMSSSDRKSSLPTHTRELLESMHSTDEAKFSPFMYSLAKVMSGVLSTPVGLTFFNLMKHALLAVLEDDLGDFIGTAIFGVVANLCAALIILAFRVRWIHPKGGKEAEASGLSAVQEEKSNGREQSIDLQSNVPPTSPSSTSSTMIPMSPIEEDGKARLVHHDTEVLIHEKAVFFFRNTLLLFVRYSYWTFPKNLQSYAADNEMLDIQIDGAIAFILFLLLVIKAVVYVDEPQAPPTWEYVRSEIGFEFLYLMSMTIPMNFGKATYLLYSDPVLGIKNVVARVLVLWGLNFVLSSVLIRTVLQARKEILATAVKSGRMAVVMSKVKRKFDGGLKKFRARLAEKQAAASAQEMVPLTPGGDKKSYNMV